MAKIKSIGFYDKNSALVEVHATMASANRSTVQHSHDRVFYYVYPSQLQLLGYAQAVDLETILKFQDETANKGNRIATI